MSLKRYEYKIIDPALWRSGDVAEIEQELNRLGREGWEVIGFSAVEPVGERGTLCLAKRKVKTHPKKTVDHE